MTSATHRTGRGAPGDRAGWSGAGGKLRVLDLFSGIGGFSLGLERTGGFETVAVCEIEPFPRQVLAKHWPGIPIFNDVRELRGEDVRPVDVICGGYPCQPFSTAGKRAGAEDDRHLWPEFSRLVAELRPAWVIGENVAGHISMGLDDVLSDLEGQGYACRTFVIPACAVGAPHRRDRCWIVAHAVRGRARQDGRSDKRRTRTVQSGSGEVQPWLDIGGGGEVLAHASRQLPHRGGRARDGWAELADGCQWLPEPDVGRVAHGVPQRVDRLKALGNAVVPPLVTMFGHAILEAEHTAQRNTDSSLCHTSTRGSTSPAF